MKRLLPLLLLLLLFALPALADTAEEIAMAIHPDSIVSQRMDADGATLMVLTQGAEHTLLMLEGRTVTVDNPHALLPGDVLPSWSFTSDAAAWSYRSGEELIRYRCEKIDGYWGDVSVTVTCPETARTVYVNGGCLRQVSITDGVRSEITPIPAPWLQGQTMLALFDVDALPLSLHMLPTEAYQPAADLLADGMQVLCGITCPSGLVMLCDKPNHVSRQLIACQWNEQQRGYQVTRSTPITIDCTAAPIANGLSLVIGSCAYDITLDALGNWGVTAMHLSGGDIHLNSEHLISAGDALQHALWGSHPWSDITCMDWQSLPHTYVEAAGCVNPSGWAMVNNPDTADRLHLRQRPDAKAYSLGRYYNGTPMRILSSSKDWLEVSIGGVTGWMMKDYVAQDYAMQQVPSSLPMKHITCADGETVSLYADQHAQQTSAVLNKGDRVLLLGYCSDSWYHVLAPEQWVYGYVSMEQVK